MQGQGRFGGQTGQLRTPSGQTGQVRFTGEFGFTLLQPGDPASLAPQLQALLQQAVSTAVMTKAMTGTLPLDANLAAHAPVIAGELQQTVPVAQYGAQLTSLQLTLDAVVDAGAAPQMPPTPMQSAGAAMGQAAQDKLDPRNYDVAAKVNVGGFKVNMSTDGGLDTDGLQDQLKDKAKTKVIGCVIVAIVMFLLAIGAVVLFFFVIKPAMDDSASGGAASNPQTSPPAAGDVKTATWDGKKTFTCSGNKRLKLSGVKAKLTSGSGIKAGGNCYLELDGVEVEAPIALDVGGNAVVKMKGGKLTGKKYAVKMLGPCKVTLEGTKVSGKEKKLGAGTLEKK